MGPLLARTSPAVWETGATQQNWRLLLAAMFYIVEGVFVAGTIATSPQMGSSSTTSTSSIIITTGATTTTPLSCCWAISSR